jgi:hypothetical protein
MSILKLLDLPKKLSPYEVLKKLSNGLRLNSVQKEDISVIYVEEQGKDCYNLRIAGDYRIINKIRSKSDKIKGNRYNINTKGIKVTFVIIDEKEEKFKVKKLSGYSRNNNTVLWINLHHNDNIIDVLQHIPAVKYISRKANSCFLCLRDSAKEHWARKKLEKLNYNVRSSDTILFIQKELQGMKNESSALEVVTKKMSKKKKNINVKYISNQNAVAVPSFQSNFIPNYNGPIINPNMQIQQGLIPWTANMIPQIQSSQNVIDLNNFNLALIPKVKYI